jgi:hypothetical protein
MTKFETVSEKEQQKGVMSDLIVTIGLRGNTPSKAHIVAPRPAKKALLQL